MPFAPSERACKVSSRGTEATAAAVIAMTTGTAMMSWATTTAGRV